MIYPQSFEPQILVSRLAILSEQVFDRLWSFRWFVVRRKELSIAGKQYSRLIIISRVERSAEILS
jgi:hypothetical protein